jgi:hypothetical protein
MTNHLDAFFSDELPGAVRAAYRELREKCIPPGEALEQLLFDHRESMILLPQERALFWIALAATQARAGEFDLLVRTRAESAMQDNLWVAMWVESVDDEATRKLQLEAARAALDEPASEPICERNVQTLIPSTAEGLADFDKESVQFTAHYAQHGIDIAKDDPSRVVAYLHRELDRLGPRYETTPKEERDLITGRASLVWVRQLLRLGGWKLSKVVDGEHTFPAVVTTDDSAWVPIFFAALDYVKQQGERNNILAPLFEEIRANRIPRSSQPGGLVSLLKFSWRMHDPVWPEQREQLRSGRVAVDSLESAMADLFSALSEAGADGEELNEETICEIGPEPQFAAEATDKQPPDARTVAGRALALRALLAYTITDVPRDVLAVLSAGWKKEDRKQYEADMAKRSRDYVARLKSDGVWEHMDASERATIETPYTALEGPQLIVTSWRSEALTCLLWALRRFDTLPPFDENVDGIHLLHRERFGDGPRDFLEAARLRDAVQIEQARTLAEMWNWRARTRQLHEDDAPFPEMPELGAFSWNDVARISAERAHEQGMLDRVIDGDFPAYGRAYRDVSVEQWQTLQSIAQERHFALNWLCGYAPNNEWLKTPTGT